MICGLNDALCVIELALEYDAQNAGEIRLSPLLPWSKLCMGLQPSSEVKIVNDFSTAQKLLISVTYQYLIFNQFQELKLDFGICFHFLLPILLLNSKYPRWKSKYLIQSISTY